MAITSTINSNWKNITGKTNSRQSALTSKVKEAVIDVTIGCADTYTTGGIVVDLSACGTITTILTASINEVSSSLQAQYNPVACDAASTATVQFHDEVAAACATALAEIACASALIQCVTFKAHVIGF